MIQPRPIQSATFFLLLLLVSCTHVPAQKRFDVTPEPAWVKPIDVQSLHAVPQNESQQGVQYLLVDRQSNLVRHCYYRHIARRIASAAGLQTESQLLITFNPSYEKLSFHYIRLWREGKLMNRLDPSRINVFQRETGLEYDLYDGRFSAMLLLDDLRVGDIIDYAFTLCGDNPIFAGNFLAGYQLQWSTPLSWLSCRVIAPPDRPVFFSKHNISVEPEIEKNNDATIYTWRQGEVPALKPDDDLPEWFDPYPWIEVSSYKDWREVVDWARSLYDVPSNISEPLSLKIGELRKRYPNKDELIIAALRFVQDEIRYFGMELGENSHKPSAPDKVYAQRFGDCKDKARLLCTILKAAGVEAYPLLLSTKYRHTIESWLASPLAFDHAIVCVHQNGRKYFFDPTVSQQGGTLGNTALPPYEVGLEIAPQSDRLLPIAEPVGERSWSEVEEGFDVPDFSGNATLEVTSSYYGSDADNVRRYFANSPRADIEHDYLAYYLKQYPAMERADSLVFQDHRDENRFTTVEHYVISDFWTPMSDSLRMSGTFYAQLIRDRLRKPSSAKRTMPLGISYPVWIKYTANVSLPETWNVSNTENSVTNKGFVFHSSASWSGRKVTFRYEFKTTSDNVSAAEAPGLIRMMDEAIGHVGYTLYKYRGEGGGYPPWFYGMVVLLGTAGILTVRKAVLRSRPIEILPAPDEPGNGAIPAEAQVYDRIGGWLFFPAIGLIITPLSLIITTVRTLLPVFASATWLVLTTPGSARYSAFWGPILIFELMANCAFIVFSIVVALYFFRRRTSTKKLIIAFWLSNLLFLIIDSLCVTLVSTHQASGDKDQWTDLWRTVVVCAIWIPYFLKSERVKKTFVK